MNETFLAFFQRNRIHDTFSLAPLSKPASMISPFRTVNHNRHTRNIWFWPQSEFRNLATHIHHPTFFVHIHVDNLCATFYLLARNINASSYFLFLYQSKKFSRTRHIGSVPHIHKYAIGRDDYGSNPDNTRFLLFSAISLF